MSTEAQRQATALADYVQAGRHHADPYGSQWGLSESDHLDLVEHWILPAAVDAEVVLEIGCGGGRWTRYFCDRPGVGLVWLVDATSAAEQAVLAHCDGPLRFLISQDGSLPEIPDGSVDWCWSFDTFVHFHAELFDRYLIEVSRVLRHGGLLHLHYAVAWAGLTHNPICFQYREPNEIETLLAGLHLYRTGPRVEYRAGYGSLLQEFRKT